MSKRVMSLELVKLLAALSVVATHVGHFSELPPEWSVNIRLLFRWAVPFFFIVSGYFLQRNGSVVERAPKFLVRILILFVLASCLYAPLVVWDRGWDGLSRILSMKVLYIGTWFHLWYLSSLIIGVAVIYSVKRLGWDDLFLPLSCIILVACVSTDFCMVCRIDTPITFNMTKYLLSIPFLYIGMVLSRYDVYSMKLYYTVLFVLVGIGFQYAEAYYALQHYSSDAIRHQFLVVTIPFAVGMFLFGLNGFIQKVLFFSISPQYSLHIYILHPLFLYFLEKYVHSSMFLFLVALLLLFPTIAVYRACTVFMHHILIRQASQMTTSSSALPPV